MRIVFAAVGILLIALQAGCSSGLDQRYLDDSTGEALALPPDLTAYQGESSFDLPKGFSADQELAPGKTPVLAKVDSLKLEGDAGFYWLSVEASPENLYQQVKNFWHSEGFRLQTDEPVIGMMQTEWVFNKEGTDEESSSWFGLLSSNDLSASQDQFKTRIERNPETQQSRVYIAHRGTAYRHIIETGESSSDKNEDNQWRFRQTEPELEIEMLGRLMIYLGLQKTDVEQQLETLKLFSPRAFKHFDSDENSPFLLLKDPYQKAWNRVFHQLERLNFDIAGSNYDGGLFTSGSITVTFEVVEDTDQGGVFSIFSSSDLTEGQVVLVISKETRDITRVDLETYEGEIDTSPEGAEFLDLLYQNLK